MTSAFQRTAFQDRGFQTSAVGGYAGHERKRRRQRVLDLVDRYNLALATATPEQAAEVEAIVEPFKPNVIDNVIDFAAVARDRAARAAFYRAAGRIARMREEEAEFIMLLAAA